MDRYLPASARPWLGAVASLLILAAWLAWSAASSEGAGVPDVQCGKPGRLELRRFEDGSAHLLCDRRLLVRVGVPW